jgi:hypothetical protein
MIFGFGIFGAADVVLSAFRKCIGIPSELVSGQGIGSRAQR